MTTKALGAVVAAIFGIIMLCALGGAALFGGGSTGCSLPVPAGPAISAPAGGWPQVGVYSPDQVAMAATIVSVGAQMGVPVRGWVIGVATAIQESSLSNPAGGDQDSIGLFQQRPSQGWGTPEQLHDPVYASQKFFAKLLTIPNWQNLPLTEAAQAVQRSAYPDAYAKWESDATMLVNTVGSGNSSAIPEDLEHCLSICPAILSNAPVDLHIASGGVDVTCSDTTLGSAEPAPRNPDGSWPEEGCTIRPDPTTGNGCVTPRLLHLVQQADAAGFPKPGCYRVDDHGEHPKGRACDWMVTSGGEASGTQKARGNAMAAWAVANADRLGIIYVIWFRMIWTQDEGWHAYNNPWGGDDPSGWHTNHVHVSVH